MEAAGHAGAGSAATPRGRGVLPDCPALLKSLRAAAATSQGETRAVLREAGVHGHAQVRCACVGQCASEELNGDAAQPARWAVHEGARHSQTEVVYRWRLPSGDERLSHVWADHAIKRGIPASWCAAVVLQHRLEEAAAEAQRQWRLTVKDRKARQRCTCTYMGQRTALVPPFTTRGDVW